MKKNSLTILSLCLLAVPPILLKPAVWFFSLMFLQEFLSPEVWAAIDGVYAFLDGYATVAVIVAPFVTSMFAAISVGVQIVAIFCGEKSKLRIPLFTVSALYIAASVVFSCWIFFGLI